MIIDVHTHLAYQKIFSEGFLSGVASTMVTDGDPMKEKFIRQLIVNNLKDENGDVFIRQMDEAGIDKAVLLIADFGYALGEAELSIEDIHLLHRQVRDLYPDKFIVFGGVDPRRGRRGIDLFEKAVRDWKFGGLKLYPPCGFELDDPQLMPLYEICNAYHVPVLSHTGPSLATMRTERRYPETVLTISAAFPGVQFILGHGGARDWETSVDVARQRPNVALEISAFQAYAGPEALKVRFRHFFDQVPDQVLFGSDWPMFIMGTSQVQLVELIRDLGVLTEAENDKLYYQNAQRILNLIDL